MFNFFIVLLPILYQIATPINVISLGELILIPLMLYQFIRKKNISFKVPRELIIFFFIPVLLTFFSSLTNDFFSLSKAITVIARIIFYFALICIAAREFNFQSSVKIYFWVCCLSAIYLYIQVFAYYGVSILLPIPRNYSNILFAYSESTETAYYYHMFGFRPASIFTEPSFYADYVAPFIAILLFYPGNLCLFKKNEKKRRMLMAIFMSISIILTTSNMGVLYCALLWTYFFLKDTSILKIKLQYKLLILMFIFGFLIFVLNSEAFSFLINRLMAGGSIGPRVLRGFLIYDNLPFINKIIGVGLNNIENCVKALNIYTIYDELDLNYTVTLTNRLITTGVLGLCSLIYFWVVQFLAKKTTVQRVLLLLMLISFIFEAGEYTFGFAFAFIWINSMSNGRIRKVNL